jgi:hypothetical protein
MFALIINYQNEANEEFIEGDKNGFQSRIRRNGTTSPFSKNTPCNFHYNMLTHVACVMNKKTDSVFSSKDFTEASMALLYTLKPYIPTLTHI